MRVYAIYNPLVRKRRADSWLLYEPGANRFSVEIATWAKPADVPWPFALYLERGIHEITDATPRAWTEQRTVCKDRHNIDQILALCGLGDYYLPTLLAITKGRSSHDDFLLEEVNSRNYRNAQLEREPAAPEGVGAALARARKAAGITQRQLAETTGIQQAVISRVEQGHGNPTLDTLERLAAGVGRELKISLD